jgi:hypothetical protein
LVGRRRARPTHRSGTTPCRRIIVSLDERCGETLAPCGENRSSPRGHDGRRRGYGGDAEALGDMQTHTQDPRWCSQAMAGTSAPATAVIETRCARRRNSTLRHEDKSVR